MLSDRISLASLSRIRFGLLESAQSNVWLIGDGHLFLAESQTQLCLAQRRLGLDVARRW
ncbi:hypothetical protein Mapa_000277 [Marchantia paleacea]|nr:hypothetical protein Mapa_000277 [Marchantia paleacea]